MGNCPIPIAEHSGLNRIKIALLYFSITLNSTNITHSDLCQKTIPNCKNCLDLSILLYFLDGKCLDQSQIDSDVSAISENDILTKLNEAVNDSTNQIDIETMLGTFKILHNQLA